MNDRVLYHWSTLETLLQQKHKKITYKKIIVVTFRGTASPLSRMSPKNKKCNWIDARCSCFFRALVWQLWWKIARFRDNLEFLDFRLRSSKHVTVSIYKFFSFDFCLFSAHSFPPTSIHLLICGHFLKANSSYFICSTMSTVWDNKKFCYVNSA